MELRLHAFEPYSWANGPGVRAVIWTQGCSLQCPGCFNPETHTFDAGQLISTGRLFRRIAALGDAIEGISVSGGEPLQQLDPLLELLQRVKRETSLSVLLFTGYTWTEIQSMRGSSAMLACVDVLIAGRYTASRRVARRLLGSANQTVHYLTERYTLDNLSAVPCGEIVIADNGTITATGIDPLNLGSTTTR